MVISIILKTNFWKKNSLANKILKSVVSKAGSIVTFLGNRHIYSHSWLICYKSLRWKIFAFWTCFSDLYSLNKLNTSSPASPSRRPQVNTEGVHGNNSSVLYAVHKRNTTLCYRGLLRLLSCSRTFRKIAVSALSQMCQTLRKKVHSSICSLYLLAAMQFIAVLTILYFYTFFHNKTPSWRFEEENTASYLSTFVYTPNWCVKPRESKTSVANIDCHFMQVKHTNPDWTKVN